MSSIKENPEYTKLRTFPTGILVKKIQGNYKTLKEETLCTLEDKEELVVLCYELDMKVKVFKDTLKREQELAAEQQRLEDEEERELKRIAKEAKERFLTENSKLSPELMDRLKYRFFNLSVRDSEDPEGTNPASSPPYFETKEEQFLNELINNDFNLYTAEYITDSTTWEKPEYMQKNLNRTLANAIEEGEYLKMLFVCFRITECNGVRKYKSLWISNIKQDLSTIPEFSDFTFSKLENIENIFYNKKAQLLEYVKAFGKEHNESDLFTYIDEIYAR